MHLFTSGFLTASCHLSGNASGFCGGSFLLFSTFVLNTETDCSSYVFNNVNFYLVGTAVAVVAMGYALELA
jgi:hypothetical protein